MFFKRVKQSVVCVVITLGVVGCSKAPDPQNDIPLFKTFIAENIDKMSDDPYISSTVKPGDKLYDLILHAQHGRWDDEDERWLDLIKKGNTQAMIWYGRVLTVGLQQRGQGYQLIRNAMLKGDPYAALWLSDRSQECLDDLGANSPNNKLAEMAGLSASSNSDICTKENFTKAVEGFERLAKQGDLRAQYFLLKQKEWDKSEETRADYIREIIRFSEAHYYQPLMDYVSTILYRPDFDYISDSPELFSLAKKLLTIASNYNYIPATERLIHLDRSIKKEDPLYLKLLKLDSPYYYSSQILKFDENYSEKELYCLVSAHDKLTGNSGYWIVISDVTREHPPSCHSKPPTSMVYIDGFTERSYWKDRGGEYPN
ncbi:sel1 repeat family protein [Vibrio parahaemolyticus]|nr:sel1 repeat family protein [Vibrio parahaemolyticus]